MFFANDDDTDNSDNCGCIRNVFVYHLSELLHRLTFNHVSGLGKTNSPSHSTTKTSLVCSHA